MTQTADLKIHQFESHSGKETIAVGHRIAELLTPPKFLILRGDLGAGKTTLVKGIAEALDAADPDEVTSPTFTLIHEYGRVYHIDLYRLDRAEEVATLGLNEIFDRDAIVLIEWGERFPQLMPQDRIEIRLSAGDGDLRVIDLG